MTRLENLAMAFFQMRDRLVERGGEKGDEGGEDDDARDAGHDGRGLENRRRVVVLDHVPRVGELEKNDPNLVSEIVLCVGGKLVEQPSHRADQGDRAKKSDDEGQEERTAASREEAVDAIAPTLSERDRGRCHEQKAALEFLEVGLDGLRTMF